MPTRGKFLNQISSRITRSTKQPESTCKISLAKRYRSLKLSKGTADSAIPQSTVETRANFINSK